MTTIWNIHNWFTGDPDWIDNDELDNSIKNINNDNSALESRISWNETNIWLLWIRVTDNEDKFNNWFSWQVITKDWAWNNQTLNFTDWLLISIT